MYDSMYLKWISYRQIMFNRAEEVFDMFIVKVFSMV